MCSFTQYNIGKASVIIDIAVAAQLLKWIRGKCHRATVPVPRRSVRQCFNSSLTEWLRACASIIISYKTYVYIDQSLQAVKQNSKHEHNFNCLQYIIIYVPTLLYILYVNLRGCENPDKMTEWPWLMIILALISTVMKYFCTNNTYLLVLLLFQRFCHCACSAHNILYYLGIQY